MRLLPADNPGGTDDARIDIPVSTEAEALPAFLMPKNNIWVPAVMICFCFTMQGLLMEKVYRTPRFEHGQFAAFLELFVFAICSVALRGCNGDVNKADASLGATPLLSYATVGASVTCTRALTLISLQFITFPTANLFKSSKVIPVMLMGAVVFQKKYSFREYLAASMMVGGVVLFTITDKQIQPKFDLIGVAAIIASLGFDALTANVQENALKFGRGTAELLLYSNISGCVLQLLLLLVIGSLGPSMRFFWENADVFPTFILSAVFGYVGTLYFTLTIKNFGAMVAVVLGIVRKALNIVCSFAIFPKPFNWVYVVAGLLFFAGLFELQAGKSFWRSNSAKRENIS